jgi:dihydroorotate dehydrogenase subfamily 1
MANLFTNFVGIKSPNPFWLASAPPTDKEYNVVRAFKAGWGGVVWKTLGIDPPIVNVNGPRYGVVYGADRRVLGLNNIELITDRSLEVNLQEIKKVKREWPDRAMVVSLMVPCDEESWKYILGRVEETEADGIELNFGCPHGMSERGMGSAVGQVPEYIEMVTRWCKQNTRMPVIVKLTPNITDVRYPARAAKRGGADAVSLINTISSITSVNLDTMSPEPSIDGKGSHGGYCGPAVKPIALNMVAEIARDAETAGLPISGIGGVTTWRDAAEFLSAWRRHGAGLHGGDDLRLQDRGGDEGGAVGLDGREGLRFGRSGHGARGAERDGLAVPEPQLRDEGADRSGSLHQVRALLCGLRGHEPPGDLDEAGPRVRGERRRMRGLQPLHRRLPGGELHHHGADRAGAGRRADGPRGAGGIRQLDDASEQPLRRQGGRVTGAAASAVAFAARCPPKG